MNKMLTDNFTIEKYGLCVRLIQLSDAQFIVSLRTDPELSKYIHATSVNLQDQINWINKYKERESLGSDYYFIFCQDNKPVGAERIYDIKDDSFKIGSLIFSKEAPLGAAIKGDIITREIGFDVLGIDTNYFEVMKENKGVNNYHLRYKPELYKEDESQFFYRLSRVNFEKYKKIYLNMFNIL